MQLSLSARARLRATRPTGAAPSRGGGGGGKDPTIPTMPRNSLLEPPRSLDAAELAKNKAKTRQEMAGKTADVDAEVAAMQKRMHERKQFTTLGQIKPGELESIINNSAAAQARPKAEEHRMTEAANAAQQLRELEEPPDLKARTEEVKALMNLGATRADEPQWSLEAADQKVKKLEERVEAQLAKGESPAERALKIFNTPVVAPPQATGGLFGIGGLFGGVAEGVGSFFGGAVAAATATTPPPAAPAGGGGGGGASSANKDSKLVSDAKIQDPALFGRATAKDGAKAANTKEKRTGPATADELAEMRREYKAADKKVRALRATGGLALQEAYAEYQVLKPKYRKMRDEYEHSA